MSLTAAMKPRVIIVGLLAASVITACGQQAESTVVQIDRPECKHTMTQITNNRGAQLFSVGAAFSLSGAHTNVPEFNDCQNIIKTDGTYGPLVGIYASDQLATTRLPVRQRGHPIEAVGVAVVFSFNQTDGDDDLGIGPLLNCLYMWRDPADVPRARMVKGVQSGEGCQRNIDFAEFPTTNEKDLAVQLEQSDAYSKPEQYPAVARWDFDATTKSQYMGIRCETAWCEIGPVLLEAARGRRGPPNPGFVVSDPYIPASRPLVGPGTLAPSSIPSDDKKVRAIKGWYDQQFLMMVGADGKPHPTGLKGMVFPDPRLGSYTAAKFEHFTASAYIALENLDTASGRGAAEYYKRKFNLGLVRPGSQLDAMNRLDLCYGRLPACDLPFLFTKSMRSSCGALTLIGAYFVKRWWVRITSADASLPPMYRCVTRRPNPDTQPSLSMKEMPATARWRWLESDETNWIECLAGCCEVGSDIF